MLLLRDLFAGTGFLTERGAILIIKLNSDDHTDFFNKDNSLSEKGKLLLQPLKEVLINLFESPNVLNLNIAQTINFGIILLKMIQDEITYILCFKENVKNTLNGVKK